MPAHPLSWVVLAAAAILFLLTLVAVYYGQRRPRRGVAVTLGLAVRIDGITCYGVTHMDMKLNQKVTLTLDPRDADKLPAEVTNLAWSASAAGLTPAPDNLSAVFVPAANGDVVFTVTGNASDGSPLTDSTTVSVVKGVAVSLGLTVGTPEPQ